MAASQCGQENDRSSRDLLQGKEKKYKKYFAVGLVLNPGALSSFRLPRLLNTACLSLPLSLCPPPPSCPSLYFFFPWFFFLPADSEFWLPPALLGDMVSQDHFCRVPRDRSQLLLLFLLQRL